MDMYQKRKERREKRIMKSDTSNKVNINWYIPTNVKPLTNIYK